MNAEKEEQERKSLLTFLQLTKEGKFAKIEESSLDYIRIMEQSEEPIPQEEYYYSVR